HRELHAEDRRQRQMGISDRVTVSVDGEKVSVLCVVEGLGTNLLGYRINGDKQLSVPLAELRYRWSSDEELHGHIELDQQSLQDAIATRCSDIKVISIKGGVPPIPFPQSDKK
ncbi:MAG: hypothetical protein K2I43_05300, partial [Alistipes sp.]|nr:hypothetical protein [Alistipes sp.]